MIENNPIRIPQQLPFLEFLCWQMKTPKALSLEEMLSRYERGWKYRSLFEPSPEELAFLETIARKYHSWLITEL
ncbi:MULTISPECIES: hypothetical protein [Synechocystis]|uniref:Uncharacterized protein n=1 Tax=Synechocystis salina LEGE 00031 TaxID=1828736 RepID=A0ABR9VVB9_9SYNC|nr:MULTISPECIES: hypothetical protein [Synechocystis]MBE9194269.1 hypothetical protein [Synechocystis sp. LEGE 06083]MBE9242083.1 hypothetical protein [Synechocystis salina LEGE 00041]MBE9255299.1 hypothetical protein [Synechocystis salina LEGE 00031]